MYTYAYTLERNIEGSGVGPRLDIMSSQLDLDLGRLLGVSVILCAP